MNKDQEQEIDKRRANDEQQYKNKLNFISKVWHKYDLVLAISSATIKRLLKYTVGDVRKKVFFSQKHMLFNLAVHINNENEHTLACQFHNTCIKKVNGYSYWNRIIKKKQIVLFARGM